MLELPRYALVIDQNIISRHSNFVNDKMCLLGDMNLNIFVIRVARKLSFIFQFHSILCIVSREEGHPWKQARNGRVGNLVHNLCLCFWYLKNLVGSYCSFLDYQIKFYYKCFHAGPGKRVNYNCSRPPLHTEMVVIGRGNLLSKLRFVK